MDQKDEDLLNLYGQNAEVNSSDENIVLEGELSNPNEGQDRPNFSTLDEPIKETIFRDLKAVGTKFKHVIIPTEKKSLLADWDLWGPLILCTFMAFLLENSDDQDTGPAFAEFFTLVWIGSIVVTVNIKLLGGHISFFQSACVIGYCLFPLAACLALSKVLLMIGGDEQSMLIFILRSVAVGIAFLWSAYASVQFLGDSTPSKRKGLAAYPMFLFYFVIAWMVLSDTD